MDSRADYLELPWAAVERLKKKTREASLKVMLSCCTLCSSWRRMSASSCRRVKGTVQRHDYHNFKSKMWSFFCFFLPCKTELSGSMSCSRRGWSCGCSVRWHQLESGRHTDFPPEGLYQRLLLVWGSFYDWLIREEEVDESSLCLFRFTQISSMLCELSVYCISVTVVI